MDQTLHERLDRYGLLPTPEIPSGLSEVQLTENARQVLTRRYVRRNREGKPAESIEGMFWRVAYHVAKVEKSLGGDEMERARQFYELLTSNSSPTHLHLLVRGRL
jgi:ribonucleoside-diphosphate reductase alpha chain